MNVFVSVGSTATPRQEAFVRAIEDRLRAEGLVPQTVGRTYFTADSPFTGVNQLMATCGGAVIVATERIHIARGTEKRGGPAESGLADVKLATPWNQIEAALAYSRRLPLLAIVEQGVREDGLLEKGFDWYVITIPPEAAALTTVEFTGVLAAWKQKVLAGPPRAAPAHPALDPAQMSVAQLLGAVKAPQLWSLLGALAVAIGAAFALGAKLFP